MSPSQTKPNRSRVHWYSGTFCVSLVFVLYAYVFTRFHSVISENNIWQSVNGKHIGWHVSHILSQIRRNVGFSWKWIQCFCLSIYVLHCKGNVMCIWHASASLLWLISIQTLTFDIITLKWFSGRFLFLWIVACCTDDVLCLRIIILIECMQEVNQIQVE